MAGLAALVLVAVTATVGYSQGREAGRGAGREGERRVLAQSVADLEACSAVAGRALRTSSRWRSLATRTRQLVAGADRRARLRLEQATQLRVVESDDPLVNPDKE